MSRFNRSFLTLSAYEVDPLSWFTGPLVPIVFATLNLAYGGTLAIVIWLQVGNPRLQFAGVIICSLACLYVHVMTRPLRPRIGWRTGAIAMGIGCVG
ncbi:MAG TPA: hypothetical protein VF479_00240, partial [Pseudolysinimonas sp.]